MLGEVATIDIASSCLGNQIPKLRDPTGVEATGQAESPYFCISVNRLSGQSDSFVNDMVKEAVFLKYTTRAVCSSRVTLSWEGVAELYRATHSALKTVANLLSGVCRIGKTLGSSWQAAVGVASN